MSDRALMGLPSLAPRPGGSASGGTQIPKNLGRREKAAIIVRLLLNEGTDLPLEELPEDLQACLTQQMGQMGIVDRSTLAAVVAEFSDALDSVGLTFPKGIAGALTTLDGKINPQTAARLRREAGVRMAGDPWDRLKALPIEELIAITEAESTEVAAVLLSKLDTLKAAELLGKLPGPLARRITYAVSQTESVTPEAVDRIGLSLAAQMEQKPVTAFAQTPGSRVGAILNQSAAATRDDMLNGLDETDKDFAAKVRKEIFTFAHVSERVNPRDVPAILREVDAETLVVALAGATEEQTAGVAQFLLSNMSQRMADNLREEVDEKGKVKAKDAEAAQTQVVRVIREKAEAGEIELLNPDEAREESAE